MRAFGGGEIMIFYFIFLRGLGRGGFCRGPNRWRRGKGLFFLIQSRWVQASNIYIYILVGGGFRGYLGVQVFMSTFEFFS